ncbi:uncharacterized protein ACNS7B_009414 isoform 1-T2 [Menidia menidia]
MKKLFWLSLLFIHLPETESKDETQTCLSQPKKWVWYKTGQSALLSCSISPRCQAKDLLYQWFVFKESSHFPLKITGKYSLRGASLYIKSLNAGDSGIYYCAVEAQSDTECCEQNVATGTTLVVRGKVMLRPILLWSSFTLLAIYSLAIMMLIILKKYGFNTSAIRKMSKSDKFGFSQKMQFRDVLQEMNSRRNLSKSKPKRRSHSQVVEAASGECNISNDDIYQNI